MRARFEERLLRNYL